MNKLAFILLLILIAGVITGCRTDNAKGGPVRYGECGDNVCDNGENTPSYPYYCPKDCPDTSNQP